MARLVLVTGHDPDALLRAAAAPFRTAGRAAEPLPLLAVRQGGLRDAVHELAAESGCHGWLGTPIVVFAELPRLLAGDLAPLDAFERAALLSRVVAERAPKALAAPAARRALLRALDRLFGDLIAEDVAPDDLGSALAALAPGEWERLRDAELRDLLHGYVRAVAALPPAAGAQRSDGRDGLLRAARAVANAPDDVARRLRRPLDASGAPRSIDVYGLGDLRRGWGPLLEALHAAPFVGELRIHLAAPSPTDPLHVWLAARADETRRVDGASDAPPALRHLRERLFTPGIARAAAAPDVRVLAAPDTTRELERIARAVKRLLVEGDGEGRRPAPHRVAIVARKARPYLTLASDVLARYGVPVHARLRHTLGDVPAVAALVRAFRVASGGWSVGGIAELYGSPYFTLDLDLGVMREVARSVHPRGLATWDAALAALASASAHEGDGDGAVPARRASRALERFRAFAARASTLDGARPLSRWIDLALGALGDDAGDAPLFGLAANAERPPSDDAPRALRDAHRADVGALRRVRELLAAWRDALALDPDADRRLDAGAWAQELETVLGDDEVTVRVGAPGGVQLVEALAAEGRSFDHLFVVGMSSGEFPADAAPDALFDDRERERLLGAGLPMEPARVWLAREDALFRALVLSPRRSLHLSYTYADAAGAPQLPSAYLDEVMSRVGDAAGDERWIDTVPGSELVPAHDGPLWSAEELLRAGASALHDDGAPEGAAERLLAAAALAEGGDAVVAQLLHGAAVERARAEGRALAPGADRLDAAHAYNGAVDDPTLLAHLAEHFGDRVWSATQLERYGRCPFTFFGSHVLRVRASDAEDDDQDVSGRDAGTVMHAALAATYRRLAEEHPGEPLSVARFDSAREIVAEEVAAAVEAHGGAYAAAPALRAARERELVVTLERYLHWEMAAVDKAKEKRRPAATELGFGVHDAEQPFVQLAYGGRTLKLRGQIDRVDEVLVNGEPSPYRYVVDHKTGASAFDSLGALRASGGILQLALYMAALREIDPAVRLWGGAYQIVGALQRKASLDRCSITQKGLKEVDGKKQQEADETIRSAPALALRLVDQILSGRFPARVPDRVDCLSYCEYRTVCREERIKAW